MTSPLNALLERSGNPVNGAYEILRFMRNSGTNKPLTWRGFGMKSKTLRMLTISQLSIFLLFMCLTLGNEIIDIPHYVFNDAPTSFSQRFGEIIIEVFIFFIIMTIQILLFMKLYKRIRFLEGFITICARCKKIRNVEDQWEKMEKYIEQHSLARFSHSVCPDCARQLYPDFNNDKIKLPDDNF